VLQGTSLGIMGRQRGRGDANQSLAGGQQAGTGRNQETESGVYLCPPLVERVDRNDRNDPLTEMLARKIIEVGATESDPAKISEIAIKRLRV
jgi:hypothetical protein